MRFLLDVHLPPTLAAAMRAAGHQCDEARRLISRDSLDTELAALANELGAAMVSKDADFVDLLARGVLRTPLGRVRLLNMRAGETTAAVLTQLPSILAAIEAGEMLIEVR